MSFVLGSNPREKELLGFSYAIVGPNSNELLANRLSYTKELSLWPLSIAYERYFGVELM